MAERPWDKPAVEDLAAGVKRERRVVGVNGRVIDYLTHTGRHGQCWITTWGEWCRRYAVRYIRDGVDLLQPGES